MTPSKITAAARKALIATDPLYHSWPPEQQEEFRATLDQAARKRVCAVLLREIKGLACTAENASEIWDDLPIAERNDLNWAQLLTQGIGENWIFLNESMVENTSLLDFQTLHDYDFNDHLFQEQVNQAESNNDQARDYYALRFMRWARLLINGRFHYANLYALAGYVTNHLEDQGHDLIHALIPHEYRAGKQHGKEGKDGSLQWDMQPDAKGHEGQLRALQKRWYGYLQQRWISLSQALLQHPPAVYRVDTSEQDELSCNFIFNNETALRQVRWRHFLADCERLKADASDVTRLMDQERVAATQWLQDTHQDIMQHFDPDVLPLRRKRKVMLAPGVFDALAGQNDGDDSP